MASKEIVYLNSDNVIEVSNLRDTIADVLLNTTDYPGLTVTARVLTSAGVVVSGTADPITLTEVTGYKGLFRGTIPDTASFTNGDEGTVEVTADAGAGLKRVFVFKYAVQALED